MANESIGTRAVTAPFRLLAQVNHPVLAFITLIGAVLFTVSLVTDMMGIYVTAGFFAMYAAVAFLLSVVGYVSIFLIKNAVRYLERRHDGAN